MRCDPIVRLAPGVSEGVANEQFASLMPQLAREYRRGFRRTASAHGCGTTWT
jgi:hypothetical protein